MTMKEYTLDDTQQKLDDISNISLFLKSGSCPSNISCELMEHLQEEIELAQSMLSFLIHAPSIKAQIEMDSMPELP